MRLLSLFLVGLLASGYANPFAGERAVALGYDATLGRVPTLDDLLAVRSVDTVRINRTRDTLAVRASDTISALVKDSAGNTLTEPVLKWVARTSGVVKLTAQDRGKRHVVITALVTNDSTWVVASSGSKKDSLKYLVTGDTTCVAGTAAHFNIWPDSLDLVDGSLAGARAKIIGQCGDTLTGQTVTWTSTNTAKFTRTAVGVDRVRVTAVDSGKAYLRASIGSAKDSIPVRVTVP